MSEPVTVAVLGAGNRGREAYGEYIREHPGDIQVVAVAEPDLDKRKLFSEEHNLSRSNQFKDWRQLLNREKLADGLIISTLDNMHVEPAIEGMKKGYKILLEKPIAPTLKGINKIYYQYKESNSTVLVAHVLRYTNFFQKLKKILDNRIIGKIRYVDLIENIGFFHFAHSYVRGNWRNTEVAAPIILAKSCHDLDILYWLLGSKIRLLSSHASREVFREEKQPEKAGDRCLDCVIENDCPYSARKIYLGDNTGWPTSVITTDLSYEGRFKALQEGPYGRCVWKCDNNVPEVQRVNMTQADNTEVNFTLTAFSQQISRIIKIFGSRGEIRGDLEQGIIKIYEFSKAVNEINIKEETGGHSGGDTGLMNQYVKVLKNNVSNSSTSLEASLESHLMAFAAEEARKNNRVIELEEWRQNL